MAIKEQCNNCKKNGFCTENIVFNSVSCSVYEQKRIDLEKHEKVDAVVPTESSNEKVGEQPICPTDETSIDFEYTQEYLKQNTKIQGWLSFFCFIIALGGLISAIYPIVTFDLCDYSGSYVLGMVDVIPGILLFVLAIMTIVALYRRDTDAIFLAKTYVIACFASNFLVILSGDYEANGIGGLPQIIRSLIWCGIWFIYLHKSNQVRKVIPSGYRKTKKRDWYLLGSFIFLPLLFLACGLHDVNIIAKKESAEFLSQISLKLGEYTDGRVIFTKPTDFTCNDTIVDIEEEQLKLFSLEDEIGTSVTLYSDYDNDQSNANVNYYWQNWEDEEAKSYPSSVTLAEKRTVNGLPYFYKVTKYDINGRIVYWRFVMIFDSSSAKVCVISSYDTGNDSYLHEILKSIRFN